MRLIASALASLGVALGLAASGPQAHAQTLKVKYDILLAGLPLGKAELASTFYGSKYEMEADARLTGLARLLSEGRGAAMSAGTLAGTRPKSKVFAVTSQSSKNQRIVRMGLQAGNVAAVKIDPPLDEKPDRVPVKAADKRGVVDPLSALLMPVARSRAVTDPANCNRTIPVFDGASRLDVVLSYMETQQVEVRGYTGPALVCSVRYVPISGHRSQRPGTKFMQENRDMHVWLAPVEGRRLLFPVRVAVRTMIGMGALEASDWTVEGATRAASSSDLPLAREAIVAGVAP